MKFALFAGYDYYPSGGWDDFIHFGETEKELLDLISNNTDLAYYRKIIINNKEYDWFHIVDLKLGRIIKEKRGI